MKVTVLMPVYNEEGRVGEAIESVLKQTFGDFEFLIIDDGSTDNTVSIIEKFAGVDKRIILIKNKVNIGITKTLNMGLAESKGEYVARMDADDVCRNNRLEKQVNFLDKNITIGMCGSWIKNFGDNSDLIKLPTDPEYIKCLMLFRNTMVHSSVMVRKSVLEKYKLKYNENAYAAQDYDLWVRLSRIGKITNIDEVLVDYRVHDGQISNKKKDLQKQTIFVVHKNQLLELGLGLDVKDIDIHELIVGQKFNPEEKLIEEIEDWLLKILRANEKRQIFDQPMLRKVVHEQWFFFCYNSASLGKWAFNKFISSKLFLKNEFDFFYRNVFLMKTEKVEIYNKYRTMREFAEGIIEKLLIIFGWQYKLASKVNKKFKIGMAILSCNRPEYLAPCLDSLFKTNLHNYDITFLIQDDGSTDPLVKDIINRQYDKKYKIVRYFTDKGHNSWGAAFNKAIKKLTEIDDFDIVGTSDNDALYHPEWLDQTMKICLWAKEHHLDHILGPFSSFNSSDYKFHRILGTYDSPYGKYIVKERMGALNYFYLKEDLLKLGLFEESRDDETLMTEKFKKMKIRNFCTDISYIEHLGKYSLLNEWRPIPVKNAVFAMNLVKNGWNEEVIMKYPNITNE
jgi:glycosyltransferase involved in cell wall biosynthesis